MKKRLGEEIDVYVRHDEAKMFVQKYGYDAFIKEMDSDFKYGLGSASVYWENDPSYICKMRGANGDVIIGWEEHHGKRYD